VWSHFHEMPFNNDFEKPGSRYLILVPILIAGALFVYKAGSSIQVLRSTLGSNTISARPEVVALGQPSLISALDRSVNYFLVIWPALAFGILIAAAVRAFVSPQWFVGMAKARSVKANLAAGMVGAPLMLCSCCVAPIFMSVAETSARLGPALGLMLASPVLNPVALTLTFILFEPKIALGRLAVSLLVVALIGPMIERIFPNVKLEKSLQGGLAGNSSESAFVKFGHSLRVISIRTVPGLLAGVVSSMLIVQWLPANVFATPGGRITAVLLTATAAVPLALPTFLEIPLALGLLAGGFPAGAAIALLVAGPAINLPSLLSVARVSGWKVAASVAAMVWVFAVCGGLLIR
jgi:uncharacterized protein